MGREQDAVIAEWCEPKPEPLQSTEIVTRKFWYWMPGQSWLPRHFSESRDVMASAEAVVGKRKLWVGYMCALCDICAGRQAFTFAVATATAAQRAEALVKMIEER